MPTSQRKLSEPFLREDERRFREMVDALPAAVYTTDAEGRLTYFNAAAVQFSGRVPELGTEHWCVSWKLFRPDGTLLPHDQCPMAISLKEGRPIRGEEAIAERPDGSRVWFEPFPTPLHDAEGKVIGGINMLLDITDRKRAEATTILLRSIVQSSDDAIISKDLNGTITSWNRGAERIFGYTAEEVIGKSIKILIPPERLHEEDEILARLRRGERVDHLETLRIRKDGAPRNISVTSSPLRDSTGRVTGASKVARDITERKRTEDLLRRAERAAATGQMAAAIAHEINNPMQALTNILSLLAHRAQDEPTGALATLAQKELHRMARITKQMLSFHRDTALPVPIKVTDALEDAVELWIAKAQDHRVRLVREYEDVSEIHGFPGEMRQLFANLLGNAIEASPEGTKIRLRVRPGIDWRNPERRGIRVSVIDYGPGIPANMRPRIFEPFFTSKEEKGSGLGLWVVQGVVARHAGSIRFRTSSSPNHHGTHFSVFLPEPLADDALRLLESVARTA